MKYCRGLIILTLGLFVKNVSKNISVIYQVKHMLENTDLEKYLQVSITYFDVITKESNP